jgi:hypothetical protein
MSKPMDPLEKLWSEILSRDESLIKTAFHRLDPSSQKTVLHHLQKMISESGWHTEQRKSAQAALTVLQDK